MFKRILSLIIIVCFFLTNLGPLRQAHADAILGLPAPGTMVNLSPAYEPVMIKGLTVHKDNPFLFDFIVDIGQDKIAGQPLKKEGEKLIKYFLASLAIPDKDVWVNLSPYEKNRMIPEALGQTDMGRDLLEQDYILKQITASLIYPEKELGKSFWENVYAKARLLYGTTQIPVNTFNKVWIMADRAEVFEHGQTAFVVDSHLKVMLEEDYVALEKNQRQPGDMASAVSPSTLPSDAVLNTKAPQGNLRPTNTITSQIVRTIILPELEKEVNTGRNFANLRQIFNSIILSSWYKKNLKEALLNQVYADKSKVKGINLNDPTVKQQIYEQYLKAYKKGVFNYIKEDINSTNSEKMPRKYFSGGIDEAMAAKPITSHDFAELTRAGLGKSTLVDFATLASGEPFHSGSSNVSAAMTIDLTLQSGEHTFNTPRTITLLDQGDRKRTVAVDGLSQPLSITLESIDDFKAVVTVGHTREIIHTTTPVTETFDVYDESGHLRTAQVYMGNGPVVRLNFQHKNGQWLLDVMNSFGRPIRIHDPAMTIADHLIKVQGGKIFLRGVESNQEDIKRSVGSIFTEIDKRIVNNGVLYVPYKKGDLSPVLVSILAEAGNLTVSNSLEYAVGIVLVNNDLDQTIEQIDDLLMAILKKASFDTFEVTAAMKDWSASQFLKMSDQESHPITDFKFNFDPTLAVLDPIQLSSLIANLLVAHWQYLSFWATSIVRNASLVPDGFVVRPVEIVIPGISDISRREILGRLRILVSEYTASIKGSGRIANELQRITPQTIEQFVIIKDGAMTNMAEGSLTKKKSEQIKMMVRRLLQSAIKERRFLQSISGREIYQEIDEQIRRKDHSLEMKDWTTKDPNSEEYFYYYTLTPAGIQSSISASQRGPGWEILDGKTGRIISKRESKDYINRHITEQSILHEFCFGRYMFKVFVDKLPENIPEFSEIKIDEHDALGQNLTNDLIEPRFDSTGLQAFVDEYEYIENMATTIAEALQGVLGKGAGPLIVDLSAHAKQPDRVQTARGIVNLFKGKKINNKEVIRRMVMNLDRVEHEFKEMSDLQHQMISMKVLQTLVEKDLIDTDILKEVLTPKQIQRLNERLNFEGNEEIGMIDMETPAQELLKTLRDKKIIPSAAMAAKNVPKVLLAQVKPSALSPGGIDLNTSNGMQWKISKDGNGVEMNIDPAMIERVRQQGIDSLSPVILRVTPIASIWPLVGLQAPAVK